MQIIDFEKSDMTIIAQDLIQLFQKSGFDNLRPILVKYDINKIDPIAIQTLINQLSLKLCEEVLK